MSLRPIEFVSRGGNTLLNGLLNRASVSLSNALSDGVQQIRDANNNQLVQERAALGEIRFERGFREDQYQDRRDFNRRVFTDDRAFGEGVRQFDITDSDRDADRALRAELGRGSLALARERLALEKGRQGDARTESRLRIRESRAGLRNAREDRQAQLELLDRANIANDRDLFIKTNRYENLPKLEQDRLLEKERSETSRGLNFYGRNAVATELAQDAVDVGLAPSEDRQRDILAKQNFSEAEELSEAGSFGDSIVSLDRALAFSQPGTPLFAQIESEKKVAEARNAAFIQGSSISREAAEESSKIYTENTNKAFGEKLYGEVVREVTNAPTREAFIRDFELKVGSRSTPASKAAATDAIVKARAAFYDSVTSSSKRDQNAARSVGDAYEASFDAAAKTAEELKAEDGIYYGQGIERD